MGCHRTQIIAVVTYAIVEAALGRRAKDGRLPFGSTMGAICYYIILPVLVFVATLVFSRKPREGKKDGS